MNKGLSEATRERAGGRDAINAMLATRVNAGELIVSRGLFDVQGIDVLPEVRGNVADLRHYLEMRALRDITRDDGRHHEYLRTLERMRPFEHEIFHKRFCNKTMTLGLDEINNKFWAGSSYTAALYMGLKGTGTPAAGDTSSSHSSWTEDQNYSQSTRPAPSFSASSAGVKATSAAVVFTMNGVTDIYGAFISTLSTKGGTTGILVTAGDFTEGHQAVTATSTLNVSYSYTLASSN